MVYVHQRRMPGGVTAVGDTVDRTTSSSAARLRSSRVVCHELLIATPPIDRKQSGEYVRPQWDLPCEMPQGNSYRTIGCRDHRRAADETSETVGPADFRACD